MAALAVILLASGVALAAASEGLMPAPWPAAWRGARLQAWGGALTILGLAAVGAGLPLFR